MSISLQPHWHEPVAAPHIIEEGGDWLVLDKPAGWLVHPTKPTGEPTLIDWLRQERSEDVWYLVNRLDRETSGLVLAAKGAEAAGAFGKITEARQIQKEYLALVHGEAPEHLRIDQPIDRLSKYQEMSIYMKQGVVPGGYPACTELVRLGCRYYHPKLPTVSPSEPGPCAQGLGKSRGLVSAVVLEPPAQGLLKQGPSTAFANAQSAQGNECKRQTISLLRLQLHTGRLHQIRVHLAWAGYPVVGDKLYGPHPNAYLDFIRGGWTRELAQALWLPRHALHAARLSFEWKGELVEVSSPLPEDLQVFLDQLLAKS